MTKSAALVYWDAMSGDTATGKRVACDFETSISPILEAHLEFRSTFTLEGEQAVGFPAAIAFYVGDTLLAVQTLKKFGVKNLLPGDTITITPPGKGLDQ
jgi:hypothetical protein